MTVTGRTIERSDICPHGVTYAKCQDTWCRARIEDIESRRFTARPIGAPETAEELRTAEAIMPKGDPDYLAALAATDIAVATAEWHPDCGAPPWALGTQWPAKTAYCPHCMRWWSGERAGHCSGCHHTFGSETAFDQHRYGKQTRRCRETDWMIGRGWWQDDKGIWRLPKPDHNPFDKEN
jgi:hypothetical protein